MKYLQVRCDQRPFFPPLEQIPLCIQLELQINPVFRPFFFFWQFSIQLFFLSFFFSTEELNRTKSGETPSAALLH